MHLNLSKRIVVMLAVAGLAALVMEAVAFAQSPAAPSARPSGPDETLTVGETIYVRAPSGLRIKEAATSRDGIVELRPVPNRPQVLQVVGIRVGSTRITLTDEKDQVTTLLVAVEPDLQFIRNAVSKQFPRANLDIAQGPDRSLLVSGTVESSEDIEPLVRLLEGYAGAGRVTNNLRVVGPNQVQLEVIVAKVDRTELRRFGFNFLWSDRADYFGSTIGSLISPQRINLRGGVGTFATDRPIFDAATNFLYGVTDATSAFLGFVEALRREGLAKVLSSPVIVERSGRPARITVGGEQPYPTPAALGQAPGVEFRRFGTIVQFLPVVLGDGRIRIQVRAEVSRLDFSQPVQIAGTVVPRFLTQEAEATVELESGQSLVLGGLIQSEADAITNKVPVLGDLPFVGTAFRRVQYEEREQELIILVTPRLVDGLWPHQRPTCFPGQETRRPTDFELFLEGILEAPPGPRPLKPDGCYRPAHWHFAAGLTSPETSYPPEPVLPPPQPVTDDKNRPTSMLPSKDLLEQPWAKGLEEPPTQCLPKGASAVNRQLQTNLRKGSSLVGPSSAMATTRIKQEQSQQSAPPAAAETVVVEHDIAEPAPATLSRPTP
jgi:Flp pilus assembly secretin CpaC